jgi:cysteine desulfurase
VTVRRDRLVAGLRAAFDRGLVVNTPLDEPAAAAPHILSVSFPPAAGRPVDGEMLLAGLDMAGVCVSAGSACTSGALEPSHVLLAMGLPRETAGATVRFSLGPETTTEEVDTALAALVDVVGRLQG